MAARHPAKPKAEQPVMTAKQVFAYLNKYGDGTIMLEIFDHQDTADLINQANTGDLRAVQCWLTFSRTLTHIDAMSGDPTNSQRCAGCANLLTGSRYCIAIMQTSLMPVVPAIGFAICWDCGPDRPHALIAASKALQAFWPEGELKPITHPEGGHA